MKFLLKVIPVISLGLIFLTGCEKQNVLAPQNSSLNTARTYNDLTIIPLGKSGQSFNKVISNSEFITVKNGGIIYLSHDYDDGDSEVELQMSIKILPNAINRDALFTLQIDDDQFLGEFGVDFYPHGIVFNQPAIFNIDVEIEDFDPSSIDTKNLDIYYENPETGDWDLMERDALNVDIGRDEIRIQVINAKIPHFSRYALGTLSPNPRPGGGGPDIQ